MALKDIFKRKRNTAYILISVLIIAGCLWAFIYAGSVTKSFKQKILDNTYNSKEADIENMLLTETKDGRKLWELFADTGRYAETNGIVILERLTGNVFDENDDVNIKASFKADKGTYNTKSRQIILYDNVIMVYNDGTSIKTDRLVYSGKNEDIVAEGNVVINRPDKASSSGMRAVLTGDYSKFDIKGRTQTRFYMKEPDKK